MEVTGIMEWQDGMDYETQMKIIIQVEIPFLFLFMRMFFLESVKKTPKENVKTRKKKIKELWTVTPNQNKDIQYMRFQSLPFFFFTCKKGWTVN